MENLDDERLVWVDGMGRVMFANRVLLIYFSKEFPSMKAKMHFTL